MLIYICKSAFSKTVFRVCINASCTAGKKILKMCAFPATEFIYLNTLKGKSTIF